MWGLAPLTHGDVVSLLSNGLPLLINLKQRFIKFIHKALNHKSPVISSVAKLSIQNPSSNCGGNYCHITCMKTCLLVLLAACGSGRVRRKVI